MQTETLIRDPEWMPYLYEAKADNLVFAHLPRDVQRQATFLDYRFVNERPRIGQVGIDTLPTQLVREHAKPIHFIFHTAFCCSTLLARALDLPGASMGLKEPLVLGSFADAIGQLHTANARHALGVTLDLLSRPLADGEVQIAKASNLANPLIPHLLEIRPEAKAIVMYSTLETYLRSMAEKATMGRDFNRDALKRFYPIMRWPGLTADKLADLSDLETAALVWLLQMRFLDDVARRHGPARIRTLRDSTLLTRSAQVMTRTGDFFDIAGAGTSTWNEVASSTVFREHSKRPARPYSSASRLADLKAAGDTRANEIAAVTEWAEDIAAQNGLPLTLGDTLADC